MLEQFPPCYGKRKRHKFDLILPSFKRGDVAQLCRRCGVGRQFPVTVPEVPLDAMSVDEIEARIFGRVVPHG